MKYNLTRCLATESGWSSSKHRYPTKTVTERQDTLLTQKTQIILEPYDVDADVSADRDFQTAFNGFYQVRRNEEWRKLFYALFEEVKGREPSYEYILRALYEATGNIGASFSSKMLATINADIPCWSSVA